MKREAFLQRVRQAAAAGRRYRVESHDCWPSRAGYTEITGDLCTRLAEEVHAVGGQAILAADRHQARSYVGDLLERHSVQSALVWEHPVLEELGIFELLAERSVTAWHYENLRTLSETEQRAHCLAAQIGITSTDFALAETGTLALLAKPGHERMASLLPPVHVAIVRREQVLSDLFDLFERLETDPLNLPSNLVLVTGPSKTGDIELTLTTGVHGPGEWHVVLID